MFANYNISLLLQGITVVTEIVGVKHVWQQRALLIIIWYCLPYKITQDD